MLNDRLNNHPWKASLAKSTYATAIEISGQPELWLKTWDKVNIEKQSLKNFLHRVYQYQDLCIILTGAGTSAFIGESLVGVFQRFSGRTTTVVPTTDLVSHPELYFQRNKPTLMVSFARSGDSPESVASVQLADTICPKIYHLVITCNPLGLLAASLSGDDNYLLVLPEQANDKALAMTGSYSSMLLAALLVARVDEIDLLRHQVETMSGYAENVIGNYSEKLAEIASLDFKRAIFLGSGPLFGTAHESHLKLQELTDGQVICKFDSFLGIRHGPKVVINDTTIIVFLFSNSINARKYELDLLKEVNKEGKSLYSIGVMEKRFPAYEVDYTIEMAKEEPGVDEEFLSICSVLPAQILGYYKSLQLGLSPDQPSASGSISRVVTGVEIYPYQ